MNPLRQRATLGGERSVLDGRPSAGEQCGRGHPILSILAVAWAYVTSLDRALPVLLCPLFLVGAATGAWGADGQQERPWRVLMVHSFGSSAPPFTTHSTAFESTLKQELGTEVDLDEASLDMARYARPDMEDAFAEFAGKRMLAWQPDLVVPIGSPAGKFVAKFRDKLFPQMPVIYTGMDRRTLPADAFANNATFVGENFDLKGLIEDMPLLVPETNNVVVILGATPLKRYWTEEFRQAFAPFMGRVKFTWVNDLSFDQMLDLVSKLPPRSFVLLGLFMRDASGVTYNEDFAPARQIEPELEIGYIEGAGVGDPTKLAVNFLMVKSRLATRQFVGRAKLHGKTVHAWTVNDPNLLAPLLNAGVANVITDDPARLRSELETIRSLSAPERLLLYAANAIAR